MSSALTLKERVTDFWQWYTERAPHFTDVINHKKSAGLPSEVGQKVDPLFDPLGWVFGPGKEGGHSFTLTGEGVPHRQLVTRYWLEQAPEIPGWTFYSTRQPGEFKHFRIDIDGSSYRPIEFWGIPTIDLEREQVDLEICHPRSDDFTKMCTFLFFDQALGELGTGRFIGKVTFGATKLANSIPLLELPDLINSLRAEHGWELNEMGELVTRYRSDRQHNDFPRGDIIVGTTKMFPLIRDYGRTNGDFSDPLAKFGANYVYVAFDSASLPAGRQSFVRGEIEDRLDAALRKEKAGFLVGGAHGACLAYIDLVLTDGANSISIIQQVIKEHPLPAPGELHYFAKEKRGHRVML